MELRQLRYFVRVVELGSMGRAAADLQVVTSALSQQISRLEGELSTRLLQRSPQGVTTTEAGTAFYREAQLTLRHAEQAARSARQARLTGTVTVGLAPTTAAVLGMPLVRAMRERYPAVRLHVVESLSGHLATLLNARELDIAVLFDARLRNQRARRWQVRSLLVEDLFLISGASQARRGGKAALALSRLRDTPLILPTGPHGLRSTLDAAFEQAGCTPNVVLEIDSLPLLMDAVDAGMGSTLQPWAAVARYADAPTRFQMLRISDPAMKRVNHLCSLSDDELSPAALATRMVLGDCARQRIAQGAWTGASLPEGVHEA